MTNPAADVFETRLLARFRSGDARAMETLFDLYADRVMGLAVRLTESREDAEEVSQEAFLRAFRHARELNAQTVETGFGPWLFAIVRNLATDRRRQLRLLTVSMDTPETAQLADGKEWLAEEIERRAERALLLSALDALPEEWRTVITLCDLEEIPHREAAQVLGRSPAATKSLLYRARRALRDGLVAKGARE